MTPDPAAVPDGWQVVRLGDVSSIRREQVIPADGDSQPYVALEHIDSAGSLNGYGTASDSISNKTVFCKGDTLYGKLRPNLRKVIRAEVAGVCSTDILAVFAREGADGPFLSQLLRSDLLHAHAMRGVAGTKMPRTSWNHLRTFTLPIPPLAEQRAIAAVLDGIDAAIERTEEVIAATVRLRDALLHELLTRGLPGRHSEWADVPGLGTVPACWEVTTVGDVTTDMVYPESTDRSLRGRAAGLAESLAGVPAFAVRCRGRAGARSGRSARLGGAEGAGARVREACAGMLARASERGRRCERASGRER